MAGHRRQRSPRDQELRKDSDDPPTLGLFKVYWCLSSHRVPPSSVFLRFYRLWELRRIGPAQRRSASQESRVQRFPSTSGPSWSRSWWPTSPTPPAPNTWRSQHSRPSDTSARTSWVKPRHWQEQLLMFIQRNLRMETSRIVVGGVSFDIKLC